MCLVYLQPKPRFPGRVGAALMSVGKRSHGKVIEAEKFCHLQDLHGSPSDQGHLLGQSLPARNKDGHWVFVCFLWDSQPWDSLQYKHHYEDALPYLQVGRQDQEDRWDLHCPKQLEN